MIRDAILTDIPFIHNLIGELALYERALEQFTLTQEQLAIDGFGDNPCWKAFVAEHENEVVGVALCYIKYSTWKGKGVFLDDLIVTESKRGYGFGKALLREVAKYAKSENANHVDWLVLDWNQPSIDFYKKIESELDPEWIKCTIRKKQMDSLIGD